MVDVIGIYNTAIDTMRRLAKYTYECPLYVATVLLVQTFSLCVLLVSVQQDVRQRANVGVMILTQATEQPKSTRC